MMTRDTQHILFTAGLFTAGDYLGGAAVGGLTAVAVRAFVTPEWDMVAAMLAGMAAGMFVHFGVGLALSPLLGMFHVMVPASLIGMYGGMLFAMRDSMQMHPGSLGRAVVVGIGFGLAVTAAVHLYDHIVRGPVSAGRAS
jgi:hypothetical protein